jgi:hypothetical protein
MHLPEDFEKLKDMWYKIKKSVIILLVISYL